MKYKLISYSVIPNIVSTTSLFIHKDTCTFFYHHLYINLRGHALSWKCGIKFFLYNLPTVHNLSANYLPIITIPIPGLWNCIIIATTRYSCCGTVVISELWDSECEVGSIAPCVYSKMCSLTFRNFFPNINSSLSWSLLTTSYFAKTTSLFT